MDNKNNFAEAGMLIRKPVEIVFQAFIDPEITTKFWFTKSSGKMEEGKTVIWTWEMYNHSIEVNVVSVKPNETIVIEWGNRNQASKVTWKFTAMDATRTYVSITNSDFKGTIDEQVSSIRDATGGFSWVVSGLKAYLEYGIELNLIADRYPKEMMSH